MGIGDGVGMGTGVEMAWVLLRVFATGEGAASSSFGGSGNAGKTCRPRHSVSRIY
jgi:hypothetical protein